MSLRVLLFVGVPLAMLLSVIVFVRLLKRSNPDAFRDPNSNSSKR